MPFWTGCSLCDEEGSPGELIFSTWGVWLPGKDPLSKYCDTCMHWDCYATWPFRPRFARSYFEFWVENEQHNLIWWRAFLDDRVFVEVNPDSYLASTWVILSDTGSRINVKLSDWEQWIQQPSLTDCHTYEQEAIALILPVLRESLPTADAVIDAVDWTRKAELIQVHQQRKAELKRKRRQHQEAVQNRKAQIKEEARQAMASGRTCPKCNITSTDYRLEPRRRKKLALVCNRCGNTIRTV